MPQESSIFLKFISKFLKGIPMVKDSDFFKKKFIDYYNIDMSHIEALLLDELKSGEILTISLSDEESQIILSSTGDEKFQQETIENNETISLIIDNTKLLKNEEKFVELKVTTDLRIQITKHIVWKRNLLLYIIFDIHKTNMALANNKIANIIKNIESILNNDK